MESHFDILTVKYNINYSCYIYVHKSAEYFTYTIVLYMYIVAPL